MVLQITGLAGARCGQRIAIGVNRYSLRNTLTTKRTRTSLSNDSDHTKLRTIGTMQRVTRGTILRSGDSFGGIAGNHFDILNRRFLRAVQVAAAHRDDVVVRIAIVSKYLNNIARAAAPAGRRIEAPVNADSIDETEAFYILSLRHIHLVDGRGHACQLLQRRANGFQRRGPRSRVVIVTCSGINKERFRYVSVDTITVRISVRCRIRGLRQIIGTVISRLCRALVWATRRLLRSIQVQIPWFTGNEQAAAGRATHHGIR